MTTKCCCCVCTTFVLVVVTSVTLFLVWYFYWKDCVDEEELTKCSNATECDIIETKLGNIKGILLPLFFVNDTFCAYRGIRYAKSPTDNLRFKVCTKYYVDIIYSKYDLKNISNRHLNSHQRHREIGLETIMQLATGNHAFHQRKGQIRMKIVYS